MYNLFNPTDIIRETISVEHVNDNVIISFHMISDIDVPEVSFGIDYYYNFIESLSALANDKCMEDCPAKEIIETIFHIEDDKILFKRKNKDINDSILISKEELLLSVAFLLEISAMVFECANRIAQ